jgi:cobalt-zinc-cadmium efflux system membrane fusion protein
MSERSIHDLESSRKLNSRYEVLASIDATVLERSITVGQIVQPAEVAFLLADLSKVWLVADIPEQNAGDVVAGKAVEAEAAAFPGEPIVGRLSFVSATVNPESRTVRVRMNVSNPRGRYKPAMLATMRLKDKGQRERVIPVTAVVRENNRDNVFMQTGPKTFVLREVELGGEFGDVRTLISGIEPGQAIVLDGAFHVNNERKKALQGGA